MHPSIKGAAIAVGAAAAVVAIGASQATAATTWTAKIGTVATGSGTYTAASSTSLVLTDTISGINVTCTSGTAAGTVPHLGSGLSGTAIATIGSTAWNSCTGVGLTFTVAQTGTWNINAASYASGVTTGNISNISAKITGPGCTFTVTGSADGTFTNSTQILKVAPVSGSGHTLTVSGVSGCFGAVNNNDKASFAGSYKVTAKSGTTTGALTLTSP